MNKTDPRLEFVVDFAAHLEAAADDGWFYAREDALDDRLSDGLCDIPLPKNKNPRAAELWNTYAAFHSDNRPGLWRHNGTHRGRY